MAIKKRTSFPDPNAVVAPPAPLNIVAKPRVPLPPLRLTVTAAGAVIPPAALRALGRVAQACGESPPDAALSVADRVALLRAPWDTRNPQELRYRNRVKNRATAITAMCVVCTGSRKLVTECLDTSCPLWAFRFGGDPFRGKRK